MCKPTKKRINYNEDILSALNIKYGYSIDYIRKSIRGDREGVMPDQLKKEYKKLVAEDKVLKADAKKKLQEKANNLN
tara:strand:+ start:8280 stop:8510 length:231 start_codon:yes stop_codon:yes gene_type:complete